MLVLGLNVRLAAPARVPVLLYCKELFGPVGVPLLPGMLIVTALPTLLTITPGPVKFMLVTADTVILPL
jgi:hypothetical protein